MLWWYLCANKQCAALFFLLNNFADTHLVPTRPSTSKGQASYLTLWLIASSSQTWSFIHTFFTAFISWSYQIKSNKGKIIIFKRFQRISFYYRHFHPIYFPLTKNKNVISFSDKKVKYQSINRTIKVEIGVFGSLNFWTWGGAPTVFFMIWSFEIWQCWELVFIYFLTHFDLYLLYRLFYGCCEI